MESFEAYQKFTFLDSEARIANGEVRVNEGLADEIILRITDGFLNDAEEQTEDGKTIILPAVEADGGLHIERWKNGLLHCEDEPAVIDLMENYEQWWVGGRRFDGTPSSAKKSADNGND